MTTDAGAWFAGKDFTTDWTSSRIFTWMALFAPRRDAIANVLEIGSWEGRSAVFFLQYFPLCHVTCIDTFSGSERYPLPPAWQAAVSGAEARFDANLAEFGARCRKVKCTSHDGLGRLAVEGRRFDLVYIDGSHHSIDVYADAAMSWPLLCAGGVLIFDDYEWADAPTAEARPKIGIDAFLAAESGAYRELFRGAQIIVEKKG